MSYLFLVLLIGSINFTCSAKISQQLSQIICNYIANEDLYPENNLCHQQTYEANISDVKIFFHSRTTGEDGLELDLTDVSSLTPTDFTTSKTSVFLIHGWHDDRGSTLDRQVKNSYLKVEDVNIFVVDWSKVAAENYIEAFLNIAGVGKIIGAFINDLFVKIALNMKKVVIIGHSMGAHVAGVAGATLESKAAILIGLDPAGPLFTMEYKDNRIDSSDAIFVQIIHTNAGLQGWNHELGHADYWPNGGHSQPGCTDLFGACAHARSVLYFAESIATGNFIAKKCDDWETYQNGNCSGRTTSWIGQSIIDTQATGNFYLETNKDSPFAKG